MQLADFPDDANDIEIHLERHKVIIRSCSTYSDKLLRMGAVLQSN